MTSTLLGKGPCDDCGSSDACATFDDGHTHCFSCGVTHQNKESRMHTPATRQPSPLVTIDTITELRTRSLTQATASRWGVGVGHDAVFGAPVVVFPYRDEAGNVVAQKIRTPDKKFRVAGDLKQAQLFGQHLARSSSKIVIITEGEFDAMAVDQALTNDRWHPAVVSIPNGAQGARKALLDNLDWLSSYEKVVLCFDMDEPGRAAAAECVALFEPGKAAIAVLPEKDANDLVKDGKSAELKDAIFNAQPHTPDGIVTIDDVFDQVVELPSRGFKWCLPDLDDATFGRRWGDVFTIGAGTGIGKTTFMFQQAAFDLAEGLHVGFFALETMPAETVRRLAGIHAQKAFHSPDSGTTKDDIVAGVNALKALPGKLHLYDAFGVAKWTSIRDRIRFLNKAHGVRVFYVDHLTALAAADPENERTALEAIMASAAALASELQVWIGFVSHLSRPEKGSHEEGARVTLRSFKGSSMIPAWSHFLFGLERDQQSDDPAEREITTLRVLKDRFTGLSTGFTLPLTYDKHTGLLKPADRRDNLFANTEGDF